MQLWQAPGSAEPGWQASPQAEPAPPVTSTWQWSSAESEGPLAGQLSTTQPK
jgi:hypothetical protein